MEEQIGSLPIARGILFGALISSFFWCLVGVVLFLAQ